MKGRAKQPIQKGGRGMGGVNKKHYRKKTDMRNFDNAKVERAKAAARDIHQERARRSSDPDQ